MDNKTRKQYLVDKVCVQYHKKMNSTKISFV